MASSSACNSAQSFVAMAMLLCFVVVPVVITAFAAGFVPVAGLIAQAAEPIPFGSFIYQLVFNTLIGSLGGQVVGSAGNELFLF